MSEIWGSLRYAFRSLRKSPVFTVVAILSLALGIGANTAIFSLLNQILLRLLPVKDPQRLVLLNTVGTNYGDNYGGNAISYPMYRDFQDQNQVFSGMFCRRSTQVSLTSGGQTELVTAETVSGSYFPTLGVGAAFGRTFTPEDDRIPSGHPIIILSYDYWRTRFAADRSILGKTIVVNGHAMTVLGVAEQGFDGVELGRATKIFVPIMMEPVLDSRHQDFLTSRRIRWVNAFGRLKPGITPAAAKASLQPFMHSMLEMEVREAAFSRAPASDRESFLKNIIDVLPGSQGRSFIRSQLSTPLWVSMALTGAVLLIACANIANLLLARAAGRQKEIAVRLAIGASRSRIVGQLLIESLLLSTLGGVAGILVAFWADKLLLAAYLGSDATGLNISIAPNVQVLLFTVAVAILTGLIFGLVPAWQGTNPDVAPTLKDQAGTIAGGGYVGLRKTLVAAQVTLSLLLLIGAGLFIRSLKNLQNLGPGFAAEKLLAFQVDPSLNGYTLDRSRSFYRQLTDSLQSIPGVRSVGLASIRILENDEWDSSMTVEGYNPSQREKRSAPYMNNISPGYFDTMGVPIVEGRDFTVGDTQEVKHGDAPDSWVPAFVIVNETFAKRFLAGRDPIGRRIGFGIDPGTKTDMEIIGVVKDIKYTNLRDEIPPQAFLPYLARRYAGDMTVYLRTTLDENQVFSAARSKVRELDANVPLFAMRSETTQLSNSLKTERLIASLSAVFGLLAVSLAAVGLYGVMAYSVTRRTREIGIRMALGAIQGNVIWMVMREVLVLVMLGILAGLPADPGAHPPGAKPALRIATERSSDARRRGGGPGFGRLPRRLHTRAPRQPHRSDPGPALRISAPRW